MTLIEIPTVRAGALKRMGALALLAALGTAPLRAQGQAQPASQDEAARKIEGHRRALAGGTPAQKAAVREALTTETDPKVRRAIAAGLAAGRDAANLTAFENALNDPSPEVRLEAVVGLGKLGTPEALADLREIVSGEPSAGVRAAAIFWLGAAKHGAALDVLTTALQDADPNVRAEAAHALGRIGTPEARTILRGALTDADPHVRAAARKYKP